jgi:hypothetical protein
VAVHVDVRITDKAVVEPGAVATLLDFETTVRHYEVIEGTPGPG